MLTAPSLLFSDSVGLMSQKKAKNAAPTLENGLQYRTLRCNIMGSLDSEAILPEKVNRIDTVNLYNNNALMYGCKFTYIGKDDLKPSKFSVRAVAPDNPKEIGRTINGQYLQYVINADVQDETFTMSFPKGTVIRDLRKRNADPSGADTSHVYIDDKTKPRLPVGDVNMSDKIAEVLRTKGELSGTMIVIIVSLIVVCCLLMFAFYQRRQLHRNQQNQPSP